MAKKAVKAPPKKLVMLGAAGLLVVLVLFVVYRKFLATPEPTAVVIAPAEPKPAPAPEPTSAAPQTSAGQMVAKAKETVAAVEEGQVAAANEAAQPFEAKATPAPVEEKTSTAEPEEAPAATTPAAPPQASPGFRAFVEKLKVGGYRPGSPARVQLNGVVYKAGEVVEPGLGIVFTGVDEAGHNLIFKDNSGATVLRHF